MNKQPVSYLQNDPRWKDKPYRVPGENSTIGSAGCGPTCAAMVIILVWWADGKIRINDPASTKDSRVNGDPYDFRSQAKYYWWVDARKYNNQEDDIMTGTEIINALTDEQAYNLLMKAQRHAAKLPEPNWSQQEGHWQRATAAGIVNGEAPEGLMKRDELAAVLGRKGLL